MKDIYEWLQQSYNMKEQRDFDRFWFRRLKEKASKTYNSFLQRGIKNHKEYKLSLEKELIQK